MVIHCSALLGTIPIGNFEFITSHLPDKQFTGTVKVWDEGIENNLQRKLMNAPCLQSKDVNWIEVRPNFHRRNLSFCLCLHNCRPFCCTFFQYSLQRVSPSNALPWFISMQGPSKPFSFYWKFPLSKSVKKIPAP
jgi:hypothetical protein